jgi:hypothetical protein
MAHQRIFEFVTNYQNIWNEIELLEKELKSERYTPGAIDSYEEADQRFDEIQGISQRIKDKLSELEGTRIQERIFLNDLANQHGLEYVQKMLEEIKI